MNKEAILEYTKDYGSLLRGLFFEKDTRFGGHGWVYEDDPHFNYHIGGYTWRIEESNINIDKYGFSFYLAYFAFKGHTLCTPPRNEDGWYDFNTNKEYKVFGFLFEKEDLGLVEVTLSGYNDDFDGGLIISQANELSNKDIALYIRQKTNLEGPCGWGWGS